MGNNTSTEEKVGGGALAVLGGVLAFTPIGPFTSTWMIPMGVSIAGKDAGPVGVGVSYADDGTGSMVHIGNPENIERERNYRVKQMKITETQMNTIRREINETNHKMSQNVNKMIIKELKENLIHPMPTTKIRTFTFDVNRKTPEYTQSYINNHIVHIIPVKLDIPEYVETIYVARRNLSKLKFNVGVLAHSGLLLKTNKGNLFVLEYGVEKNKVSCNLVDQQRVGLSNFDFDGYQWSKQIIGTKLSKQVSVDDLQKLMETRTGKTTYNMLLFNCHMAQEQLRRDIDLRVDNPYVKDEIKLEYEFMMMMDQ